MQPPSACQACSHSAVGQWLVYRRGDNTVHRETLLQCDVCERFACAACLEVYDILSGYDFLCHACARELMPPRGTSEH
jgi:hypothetical protein